MFTKVAFWTHSPAWLPKCLHKGIWAAAKARPAETNISGCPWKLPGHLKAKPTAGIPAHTHQASKHLLVPLSKTWAQSQGSPCPIKPWCETHTPQIFCAGGVWSDQGPAATLPFPPGSSQPMTRCSRSNKADPLRRWNCCDEQFCLKDSTRPCQAFLEFCCTLRNLPSSGLLWIPPYFPSQASHLTNRLHIQWHLGDCLLEGAD